MKKYLSIIVSLTTLACMFSVTSVLSAQTVGVAPSLSLLSPNSGPTQTQVTITGSGFTATGNKIIFGTTGSENNPAYNLNSADGKTLVFTVPTSNYYACQNATPPCYPPVSLLAPGTYAVSVTNANGTSGSSLNFIVSDANNACSNALCTAPLPAIGYATTTLFNRSNLTLSITPFQFDSSIQKWNYTVNWVRPNARSGSIYVNGSAIAPTALGTSQTSTGFVLNPNTKYRITFYSSPNARGVKIINTVFRTPSSLGSVSGTQTNSSISSTSTNGGPFISSVIPSSGQVGSAVVLLGTGFSSSGNVVTFGTATLGSFDSASGQALVFTVPRTLNPGCSSSTSTTLCPVAQVPTTPGQYTISVTNGSGTSNTGTFTVTP